jgi:hypothetical protein
MLEISNVKVYDLEECVIACRNAMRLTPAEYTKEEFEASLPRAISLSKLGGGSGHTNFRKGIRVSFDIKYPNYISPELQRYGFIDIVTSSSTMHKLLQMDMQTCFNKYVKPEAKKLMEDLIAKYQNNKTYENFMEVVSNCPRGIELFMRCSTNYEQLATIYRQRHNHKLKEDWGAFCDFIKSLPYAKEFNLY